MRFLDTPYGDINLWAYRPVIPFNESYEWLTYLQDSYSGINRATRFRNAPRHAMEIESPIPKVDLNNVYHLLHQYKTDVWAMPSWADAQPISIETGETTLPMTVDESIPWVVLQNQHKVELIFFDDGSFAPLENTYTNAILAPLRIGRIITNADTFNNTISGRVSFLFQCSYNTTYEPDAPERYKCFDVYTDTCSLFENPFGIPDSIFKRMDAVDSVTGIINYNSPWNCSRREREYRVFNNTKEKYNEFKDFLFRRAGRYEPFWMPTWNDDLTLVSTGALGTEILVSENGFSFCRSHLAVRTTGGDWIFREVVDAEIVGESIQLTLDSSLGINASDVNFISYLGFHRLGTDRVEIGHINNQQSISAVSVVEMNIDHPEINCEPEESEPEESEPEEPGVA
jgi:hypothetical protein